MKPFNLLTLMGLLAAAPLCATSLVIGSTDTTSTAKPFLQVWGTLATADTADETSGTTSAYCVDSLVVNATGALSLAETYTVPSTGSIGGTGSVTGDVTFSDGATLDATSGAPLSVTGTVIHSGKTQITLSTAPTDTTQLLAITSETTPTAPETYSVTADGSEVTGAQVTAGTSGLYVSVPVSSSSSMVVETTDSEGTTTSTAIDDTTAKEALATLIQADDTAKTASSVKVSGTTKTEAAETTTLTADQLAGALACFEDVTTVTTEQDSETGATIAQATVAYNFGISQMKEATVDSTRYIVVGVEVQKSDGTAATYASGTSITLTSGTTVLTEQTDVVEVTSIDGTEEGSASTTDGMKYFRIPLETFTSITSPIEVKATNTGTSTASIAE